MVEKFESEMTFALDDTIATQMIYLQLQINLIDDTFTGSLQQNLSLVAVC